MRATLPIFTLLFSLLFLPAAAADTESADRDWPTLARNAARGLTASTDPLAWNRYGYYQYRAGVTTEAFRAYRRSLALRPGFAVAWNNLGALHLSLEEYEEAERCFYRASQLDAGYSKARFNLAVSIFRQGRYYEALRTYLRLRDDDPAYAGRRGDWQKAERELRRALDDDPDDPVLREAERRLEQLKQKKSAYDW